MDNQNQPQPISSNPIIPANKNSDSYGKRNWMKWLLIYFVIAIIIYGGAYFVLSRKTSKPYSINNPNPTITVQPTTTLDKTSNWQTYRNEEFGFEVKYPSEFSINRYANSSDGFFQLKSDTTSLDGVGFILVINVMVKRSEEIIDDPYTLDTVNNAFDLEALEAKFGNGVKAGFSGDPPRGLYDIWIPLRDRKDQGIYFGIDLGQSDYPGYGGNFLYRNIAKQILSTFRFVQDE